MQYRKKLFLLVQRVRFAIQDQDAAETGQYTTDDSSPPISDHITAYRL